MFQGVAESDHLRHATGFVQMGHMFRPECHAYIECKVYIHKELTFKLHNLMKLYFIKTHLGVQDSRI